MNVALGTDGMCSNDGNDMYATLKVAALLHKLWEVDYDEWLGADEAWAMATANGAAAAGDPGGLGRIEPGRRADLVLLDLETIPFTPLNDALRQVVLGSTTLAVDSALVGGRWVLRGGVLTGIDEAAILAEARSVGAEIVARHDEGFELGRQLLAGVRAGWREAMTADVGVERKLHRHTWKRAPGRRREPRGWKAAGARSPLQSPAVAGERVKLVVSERTKLGSSESRRLRKQGLIPGVLYGRETPVAIAVGERDLRAALPGRAGSHAVLDVAIDGGSEHSAILKEFQRDKIRGTITHVDLR